jgi:hypothetical protein
LLERTRSTNLDRSSGFDPLNGSPKLADCFKTTLDRVLFTVKSP